MALVDNGYIFSFVHFDWFPNATGWPLVKDETLFTSSRFIRPALYLNRLYVHPRPSMTLLIF